MEEEKYIVMNIHGDAGGGIFVCLFVYKYQIYKRNRVVKSADGKRLQTKSIEETKYQDSIRKI